MRIQVVPTFGKLSQSVMKAPDLIPLVVLGLLLIAVGMLAYGLFKESSHAIGLYILVVILSLLWFSNSTQFKEQFSFFDPFFLSLIHLLLLLLFSGLVFYLAPKQSRELGFLIYGLAFSSPTFREVIKTLDKQFFALFFFVSTLVVVMNFSFTVNTSRITLETFLLYIFAAVTVALNIYASIILLAFIATLPKGYRKDYIYIGLMVIVAIILLNVFGASTFTKLVDNNKSILIAFIKESLVQLVLLCYLFATNFRVAIRMKGEVLLLLILTAVYFPFLSVYSPLFAPLIIVLSTLSIRLTQKLHLITQT